MNIARKLTRQLAVLPIKDHRYIGIKQKLFFFSELSQGSCFFLPRGAHIYNKLIEDLKLEYKSRGYFEVITPNIYNCDLWRVSGHWEHYEENMMKISLGDREFSLKPMNCPGHCLMFKQQQSSISDQSLPIRWADFGVLHRNELSGSLIGLTRVRRFQQDDAHIFCRLDQIESEVRGCLNFAQHIYNKFDFKFDIKLSLRPDSYLGDRNDWDRAEASLREALKSFNLSYTEQEKEGAFYGPKIDLAIKDNLGRSQQCATIQLDFQLPEKFQLFYKDSKLKNTFHKPVIIHRAILGSLERFIAMLAENLDGRWPFWLSPMQAVVIPVHTNFNDYAKRVHDELKSNNFWVECDLRNDFQLNKKIRDALLLRYNLIIIVGQKELDSETITCRVNEYLVEPNEAQASESSKGSELEHNQNMKQSENFDDLTGNITEEKREFSEKHREVVIHNINLPLKTLIDYMKEFERRQVKRADFELLKLVNSELSNNANNNTISNK